MQVNREAAVRLLLDELVGAAIPDLDAAGAVVPGRDLALEGRVRERVVLDVDGEVLRAGLERHALRDRPAGERAVSLEPEVVVEPASIMALNHEDRRLAAAALGERLRRLAARSLALVVLQRRHETAPSLSSTTDIRTCLGRYSGQGKSLWNLWKVTAVKTALRSGEHAHRSELCPPARAQLVARNVVEFLQGVRNRCAEQACGLVRTLVRASYGLGNDSVDHA